MAAILKAFSTSMLLAVKLVNLMKNEKTEQGRKCIAKREKKSGDRKIIM